MIGHPFWVWALLEARAFLASVRVIFGELDETRYLQLSTGSSKELLKKATEQAKAKQQAENKQKTTVVTFGASRVCYLWKHIC